MSDTVLIALLMAVPPTIVALVGVATLLVAIRNSQKSSSIIDKTNEIHTLTNSSLTKVQNELRVMTERVIGLEKAVATSENAKVIADEVAAKLAEHAANDRP